MQLDRAWRPPGKRGTASVYALVALVAAAVLLGAFLYGQSRLHQLETEIRAAGWDVLEVSASDHALRVVISGELRDVVSLCDFLWVRDWLAMAPVIHDSRGAHPCSGA